MTKIELLTVLIGMGALGACTQVVDSRGRQASPPALTTRAFHEETTDEFDPPDTCDADAGTGDADAGDADAGSDTVSSVAAAGVSSTTRPPELSTFTTSTTTTTGPECEATDACTEVETDGGIGGRLLCYAIWFAGDKVCKMDGPPQDVADTICPKICEWKFPGDDLLNRCKRAACLPICKAKTVDTLRQKCRELNDYVYDKCIEKVTADEQVAP